MSHSRRIEAIAATVEITPEPTPEERVAILAALEQVLSAASRADSPAFSAWAVAGRRESLLGRAGGSRAGWGRGLDGEPGC